jgi:hypothetical protein
VRPQAVEVSLTAPIPRGPEERVVFRLGQLALLFEVADTHSAPVRTVDRLGYYDFFSANPFIVVDGDARRDSADRLALRLAGFSDRQLSYASTGQRFASRRRRLQHDLALLIAYGLVTLTGDGYELTDDGRQLTGRLTSVYADAYREAARVVLQRLKPMSDARLRQRAQDWLGRSWLLLDLFDDVLETVPQRRSTNGGDAS